jgi:hypothetical protein
MQPNTREFVSHLNKCLDEIGMPINLRERSLCLSKMLHIPKHQARGLLEGFAEPNNALLKQLSQEFDVDARILS